MDVTIYQSYYEQGQVENLDPAFVPFDNTQNARPELREYHILDQIIQKRNLSEYWGLVSWRWSKKTLIPGNVYLDWIRNTPGYDVYHCNPWLEPVAKFKNTHTQGESVHPGIISFTHALMAAMGIKIPNLYELNLPPHLWVTCHYYVGNTKFWNAWFPFLQACVQKCLEVPELNKYAFHTYTKHYGKDAEMFPFIVERLAPIFLLLNEDFKVINFPYDNDYFHSLHKGSYKNCISAIQRKQAGEYFPDAHIPRLLRPQPTHFATVKASY